MRVLITVFPKQPVYFTIAPLAWAFRMAGHEVRVAAAPALTRTVIESGLPAVPIGPEGGPADMVRRAGIPFSPPAGFSPGHERWPDDWACAPERLSADQRRYFEDINMLSAAIAEAQLDDLLAFSGAWSPDLVVHDATQFAGAVAAQVAGVPAARYLLGIPGLHRLETAYGAGPTADYLRLFEKFGVAPRVMPDAWIDPCPASMQYAYPADAACLPMRHVPYNGPGTVPAWAYRPPERPRVCLTWGATLAEWEGAGMVDRVRQTITAVGALGVELVVLLSPKLRDLLGDVPGDVRFAVDIPLNLLLADCALMIHHAGPSTSMTSAAYGVPQLTITNHPHNALIGARLAATGAGRHTLLTEIPAGDAGVAAIRASAAALLEEPRHRRAAAALRAEVADRLSPADVVAHLEKLF